MIGRGEGKDTAGIVGSVLKLKHIRRKLHDVKDWRPELAGKMLSQCLARDKTIIKLIDIIAEIPTECLVLICRRKKYKISGCSIFQLVKYGMNIESAAKISCEPTVVSRQGILSGAKWKY